MFLEYPEHPDIFCIFCEIVVITPGLFFLSLSSNNSINKLFLNLDSIKVRNINTQINNDYVTVVVYTFKHQATTTSIIATAAATLAIQVRDRGLKKSCVNRVI